MFEHINFVAGRRGAVVEDDFYIKLERLSVQAGKRDKILAMHVQRICEAHDTVIQSYYQQMGCLGSRGDVSGESWRTSVCVNNSQSLSHQLLKKAKLQ